MKWEVIYRLSERTFISEWSRDGIMCSAPSQFIENCSLSVIICIEDRIVITYICLPVFFWTTRIVSFCYCTEVYEGRSEVCMTPFIWKNPIKIKQHTTSAASSQLNLAWYHTRDLQCWGTFWCQDTLTLLLFILVRCLNHSGVNTYN